MDSYIEELLTKPQMDEKLAKIASDEKDLDQRLQALRTDLKRPSESSTTCQPLRGT